MAGVKEINEPGFEAAFWSWWDSLDKPTKRRFEAYKEDAAHIYFYNTVWLRKNMVDKPHRCDLNTQSPLRLMK